MKSTTAQRRAAAVRQAFTLVELLVVISIIGLLVAILLPSLSKAKEQARSVKCLANLHAQMIAVVTYTADYSGILPGPVHPAIKRKLFTYGTTGTSSSTGTGSQNVVANADKDRQKSLTWVLRPYYGNRSADPRQQNKLADEVASCPTAERLVPDSEFFAEASAQTQCWRERPYSYTLNSWGPTGIAFGANVTLNQASWTDTDPPHYFGAWFYCDSSPALHQGKVSWRPKNIDRIRFAGAEWAMGDAWFRRVSDTYAVRPGQPVRLAWQGTFTYNISENTTRPIIPDRPFHGIKANEVSSHKKKDNNRLPEISYKGRTNLGFFDGHAASDSRGWRYAGDAGTVNPYWDTFGGNHPLPGPWSPPDQ